MCGFLLAACLILAFVAWVAMNYVEDDIERFHRWVRDLPER
jgi:hypothetical protein